VRPRRGAEQVRHLPPWAPRGALTEWHELHEHPILAGEGCARGDGEPVLLVAGFGAPPRALEPLQAWLATLGYVPHVFSFHLGLDCGERTAAELGGRLRTFDEPPIVIAHSRGGQFARVAATRAPERVRALVTLGSPFLHVALQPPILAQAAVLSGLGTLGVRNVIRVSCVRGRCCERFRHDLSAAWPRGLPFVSIYSPRDRTVRPAACVDPAAINVAIDATHVGMLASVASFTAIADAFATVRGAAAA
jgi:triacylglycerol lipase